LKDQYEVRHKVHTLAEGREFALGTTEVGAFDPHDDPEYKGWPAGAKPGLDMGLFSMPVAAYPPGVGLKEPRLVLPPANEPLYLKHRPGEAPTAIKPKSRLVRGSAIRDTLNVLSVDVHVHVQSPVIFFSDILFRVAQPLIDVSIYRSAHPSVVVS
jgi:hypothetical protein